MSFREQLDQILSNVEGSIACSLMGMDGIPVETRQASHHAIDGNKTTVADIQGLMVEYGTLLKTLKKTMQTVDAGTVAEISVNTERILTVARMLTDEYFIVLALCPWGNYGKARFALRVAAPELRRQIG